MQMLIARLINTSSVVRYYYHELKQSINAVANQPPAYDPIAFLL
jgi:hypothetical protein